ncbi:MAG TPA: preprotein translocase subunit SecY [Candidatus Latescibacteria bacterium]|nr:preprotein translocase subunit SecY [Candidatus Latescibacterota bacterium]HOT36746.1 preprotein translocase subunit SecY [Candidatus Latescibacterota bacterium]HPC44599.1 preprotein translocase subunit SecY [Candidatus Latescibacterota bacterium]HQK21425.1 preprotein translocase subunit SecY [Candidatus Latescibacterota bacterium]HRU22992.1 preprotein translocase subunit SecY [Candidatus Latescibacterota bacterium]
MLERFRNIFNIPELRNRILFTFGVLIVYRIGGAIPTPGVNSAALAQAFSARARDLFAVYDLFAGGAFKQATIFALGIMPYISASIIFQLLGSVWAPIQQLQKEGQEGQKKINQYTRYLTVALAAVQSLGVSQFLIQNGAALDPGIGFRLMVMLTMTTGTVFVMWLGEQISERGIGNGISLIIFIGIVARFPHAVIGQLRVMLDPDSGGVIATMALFALMFVITAAVVLITQGTRRIPVRYASQRVVGGRVYGGQSTHLPLKVNAAGVIPIIFAQSIVLVPTTVLQFAGTATPESETLQMVFGWFQPTSLIYWTFYSLLIIFFSYFYTAIIFNPVDVADNLKRNNGFIPGVRPGKKTAEYIDRVLNRITLPGSIYLALIAALPFLIISIFQSFRVSVVPDFHDFFGGTGLLIVVGVALDTLDKVESHLLVRHYDGFMKGSRLRSRRR